MIDAQGFIFLPFYTEGTEKKAEGKRRDPLSKLEMCQPISSKAVALALGKDIHSCEG